MIDDAVLQLIAKQNGEHTWYTLDRALAGKFDVSRLLIPALKQLAQDGLVDPRGPAHMPIYWLTDKGKARAEEQLRAAVA